MAQSGSESTRTYSRSSTGVGGGSTRRSLSSMSTTPLSLQHAINIDGNKPAVIIEIGAQLTKIGFAGEFSPRNIIRTEYMDEALIVQRDLFNGVDETKKSSLSRLFHFFKHIYFTHLLTVPRERRVVIIESLLTPSHIRRAITVVVLEMLEAPSILFAPSHLMATFPFNTNTALVFDLGWTEACAMPIAEGITMLSQWEAVGKGGKAVTKRLKELLEKDGIVEDLDGSRRPLSQGDWHVIDQAKLLEDILVRGVFVTRMSRADAIRIGEKPDPQPSEMILPMGTEMLVVPGHVRELAAEVLFDSSSEDEPGLHEMIHNIVARCPLDLRKKLFSRLLVVGGLAHMPGLLPRLKAEIVRLGETRQLKTTDSVGFYMLEKCRMESWMSWLGGSMFGCLSDTLTHRSLTKEDWMENRRLSDCTHWNDPFEKAGLVKTRA
ncbi:arp-11 [Pristionchus pacificus]|uniref:Arp-11 n=1 Tax=Pristionchus pacificus TaxID=54126 RepID=A0A2A6CBS2_PRIPA|nr:arp-11 [Pristionchus pacificus]|eukprot:PDM75528.1 arp-11 [Pristionchus pacificus]